jgi:predicted transcriptional regulator
MKMLSCLSKADEAVEKTELIERAMTGKNYEKYFQNIIQNLEHDGYIEKLENGWIFRAVLLKDWWRHRYGDM